MTTARRRWLLGVCLAFVLMPRGTAAQESQIAAEFRKEGEHLRESCTSVKALMSCALAVVTGHPLHLALGSLAPQSGFALGAAFSTSHSPNETWRLSWSGDGVRSFNGSWRTGAYMKLVHIPEQTITVLAPGAPPPASGTLAVRPSTVFNIYAQAISLQNVSFYGIGADSPVDDQQTFGMRHTVIGGNVIAPVANSGIARRMNITLLAEVNGRFVAIRDGVADGVRTMSRLAPGAIPGLNDQPDYLQLGEGVRLKPSLIDGHLQLNYVINFQQFVASGSSHSSFQRWRVDLAHEIPLYGHSSPATADSRDSNGPNDCAVGISTSDCPPVSRSRDRRGAISLRATSITSITSQAADGNAVPFYLQPTLGGSDINGQSTLPAFADYRFRGPHLLLFQQSIEHSVWGPLGVWARLDQGMVSSSRRGIAIARLRKTYSGGVTVRAGGFPMMVLSYAAGGGEGRHFAATINTSLLGGSSRPALD